MHCGRWAAEEARRRCPPFRRSPGKSAKCGPREEWRPFRSPGKPRILTTSTADGETPEAWIDFTAIPEHADSSILRGRTRFLLLAASFGEGLSDVLSGLGRETVVLALAAVSHATGSHQHSGMSFHEDARPKAFTHRASLYPWPAETLPGTSST